MTDQEILQKAIDKAIKNGLVDNIPHSMFSFQFQTWNWHNTIFSHDFAKAFWGDYAEEPCDDCKYKELKVCEQCSPWAFHLRKMVLEENPIKYLEKFL